MNPFISICIPTFKNVDYVQRLLQSISIQTFKDYEVIITDDSPDEKVMYLADIYKNLPAEYYKNEPVQGIPRNWNTAIQKAKGTWIKIMHDDDWFADKTSLQHFADAAQKNSSCHFIFSACSNVNLKTGKIEKHELTDEKKELLRSSIYNLVFENFIGHPSAAMHKNVDVYYSPDFKWLVDIDFYLRYLERFPEWNYISKTCINIGIDAPQLSNQYYKNPKVEIPEYFHLLQKNSFDLLNNQNIFHAFWILVKKFKIENIYQIREAGYEGFIPKAIFKIIEYQKNIPHFIIKQKPFSKYLMKKCFRDYKK